MKDLSILHFVIIFIFIAAIVIAFLIFSGVLPGLRDNSFRNLNSPILFWGTLPEQVVLPVIDDFQDEQSNNILVEYTRFDEDTYLKTILNALAEGNGPDVWILPQQKFIEHSTKILFLGPKSFPERLFREQFFDGADIFLWPPGRIAAVPFYTDQLVLFWSREHFRSAGIAAPPKNWSGFLDASMRLTKKDSAQTIIQAGAALGNFANNNNAKDVVTLFMLQSKNPITYISTTGSSENLRANLRSALGDSAYDDTFTTISSSIRFFDQFADPRKTSYSWPRSMGEAQDAFAQGKLSMYLGYGSEIPDIQKRNPHLDFGVAETPQLSNQELKTYGKLYGLVLSGQSEPLMQSAGLLFINFLTGQEPQTVIAKTFWVAPTLRALLATPPEDAALATIYASAVKNQFWYDPQTEESGKILRTMTEDAAFEQKSMESVVNEAHLKFQRLLQTISLP